MSTPHKKSDFKNWWGFALVVANLLTVKNELRHVRVQFWVGEFILYVWSAGTERRKGTLCVLSVTGTEPGPRANCTASLTWSGGSKPAELFQVWLYLKTINLLDFPCWVLVQEHWLPIVRLHNRKIYQSSSLDRCQKRYHYSVTLALHWKVLFINLVSLWTAVVFLPLVSLPRIFHLLLYICFVEKTLQ